MALSEVTADFVLKAIDECDRLGRDTFLARYGYGLAREYLLLHEGREYDSKAILGVAHQLQFGEPPPYLSGGDMTVRIWNGWV